MKERTVWSIGHSNHSFQHFCQLLKQHKIQVVWDVRSVPYSRQNPQYNRETLEAHLQKEGIGYHFAGEGLGGRISETELRNVSGDIYSYLSGRQSFQDAIQMLLKDLEHQRIAMVCSEKDPCKCHRAKLIARYLLEAHQIETLHILENGEILSERERQANITPSLFDEYHDEAPRKIPPLKKP